MLNQKEKQNMEASLSNVIKNMEKILSSLANEDALKIFIEAGKGIKSSTETIKKLNLTQKIYYTWLKRLIDAGLVEKIEDAYVQTMLGKFCFNMGKSLSNVVTQRGQLELADKLMRSNTLSVEEKEEVLRTISKEELLGTSSLADVIHEVKMIVDYDHFVNEVIELLNNAKESAYLAASKTDLRVTDAVLNAIDRGAKFFILFIEIGLSESLHLLRMILNPMLVEIIRKWLTSTELNVRLTKNLSYSFVVVDGEYGIIELPHPERQDFYVAFKFRHIPFCQSLINAFTSIYEKGKEDPRIGLAKKYLSSYK